MLRYRICDVGEVVMLYCPGNLWLAIHNGVEVVVSKDLSIWFMDRMAELCSRKIKRW